MPVRRVVPRRRDAVVGGVLALLALHVAFPDGFTGEVTYLTVTVGAAVAAFAGALRQPRGTPDRWAAMAIALGVASSGAADLLYEFSTWLGPAEPDVSPADVPWLASYVGVAAGMLILASRRRDGVRTDHDALLNVAAAVVLSLLVIGPIVIGPTLADRSVSWFVRGVWAAYPVLDSVLLALVLPTLLHGGWRVPGKLLVAAGAACWLISDFGFLVVGLGGALEPWLDAGWMGGAAALGAASSTGLLTPASTEPPSVVPASVRPRWGGTLLVWTPLLIPSVIEIVGFARGEDANPVPLTAGTAALVAVGMLRWRRIQGREARARQQLQSQQRLFGALAANSSDAVVVVDAGGTVLIDPTQVGRFLAEAGSCEGADLLTVLHPVDLPHAEVLFARSAGEPGEVVTAEVEVRTGDGHRRWLNVRMVNLIDDPDVGGIVVTLHDITDRKQAEEELAHQAFHDVLTDLSNRALFLDRVEHALAYAGRTGRQPAVLYLDLDGFKTINDSLGHEAGDALLRVVADRLLTSTRSGDTVARIGGDEFAVLMEQSDAPYDEAQSVADRILEVLAEPVPLCHRDMAVSASIGIAVAETDSSPADLLRNADIAMYQAKAAGRARWTFFDRGMRSVADERLRLEADLNGALERGEFRLAYQPVVDLATEHVTGFEALLRWHHPGLGVIPPDRFIPVAEANGHIVSIGTWVLEEACRTAARWRRRYPQDPPLTMAVNLSACQITAPDLVATVTGALERSGLEPSALVLEMTESVVVHDATLAADRLAELRDSGIRLAIDDFGTGYSSLAYLRQFPVDILKIDRSFVEMITDEHRIPTIVRGLLALARTLNLETIAEGVELPVQRDRLREEHCASGQGYLFARPLEGSDAERFLAARRAGQWWSWPDGGGVETAGGGASPRTSGGAGVPAARSPVS